jgi:hypothetical protein
MKNILFIFFIKKNADKNFIIHTSLRFFNATKIREIFTLGQTLVSDIECCTDLSADHSWELFSYTHRNTSSSSSHSQKVSVCIDFFLSPVSLPSFLGEHFIIILFFTFVSKTIFHFAQTFEYNKMKFVIT